MTPTGYIDDQGRRSGARALVYDIVTHSKSHGATAWLTASRSHGIDEQATS